MSKTLFSWDHALIALANDHLSRAANGNYFTAYHIEATIAALHANAGTYASTDWSSISRLYDQLLLVKPSPIVALNRAIALAELQGPARGSAELANIRGLEEQHIFHAVRGEFLLRSGKNSEAREAFEQALRLTTSPVERELLTRKLHAAEKAGP